MRLTPEFDGLEEFVRQIAAVRQRMRDLRRFLRQVAIYLRAGFAENFNAEGRPEHWAPLSPSTIADKQRLFEAGAIRGRRRGIRVRLGPGGEQRGSLPGILMRSGALKDSVARSHTRGNIERIRDDGSTLEVGSSLAYADVHDQGGQGSYTVSPGRKGFLAWFGIDRKTGQPAWIFSRRPVRHPPMPRRSFLVITEDVWQQIIAAGNALVSIDGDTADNRYSESA
jgi:phage gpG-like protein